MTYPKAPDDEQRVAFLESLAIMDTAPQESFDRLVHLCRQIFGVSISTISLLDAERQWFKAEEGLGVCETDRESAFCNYTIVGDEVFEVCDAAEDPRFSSNPLVLGFPHIRYYAGAPVTLDGQTLGALCLIDSVPHAPLTAAQREILQDLAALASREIQVQVLLRGSLAALAGL